ncbi:cysteine synthase 2 [Niveomyces insectorum RCEF 264]|uniref:Cysteine synthase 2 n=1 Tax=Niveomyces insectorum RCEF 264 TaxID=1081102 RepID=A0A167UY60_9HYPO|nr:cysteine synthase 2 [Niveomyces insectorum RCEF 264]
MSLQDHPRAYGAAALTVAFAAGVLMTLGFKDLYPDLEQRFQAGRADKRQYRAGLRRSKSQSKGKRAGGWLGRGVATGGSAGDTAVRLEDRESADVSEDETAAGDEDEDGDWSVLAASESVGLGSGFGGGGAGGGGARGASIADGIAGCIGDTPLVRIHSLSEATGCEILAKAELLNPGGSPKDRVALAVIRAAEAAGRLVPHRGDTIYEGTVGSTGISLATLARALGYRAHICMPDDQSIEKTRLLREMGAVVERVPVVPIVDPNHYVHLAARRAAEHAAVHKDGSQGFFADQFETPANAEAHRRTTGPEILRQLASSSPSSSSSTSSGRHSASPPLAAFVCGAGTAGTLTGVARALKVDAGLHNRVRIVAADPPGSGLFHLIRHGVLYAPTEKEGTRRRSQVDTIVEGIGMNRMTATLEAGLALVDDAVPVTDAQACRMARWLVEHDGIFAGSSTAVNCVAAVATALTLPPGSRVVTVLCDSGLRHLSKFYKAVDALSAREEAVAQATRGETIPPDQHGDDLLGMLGLTPRKEAI